MILSTRNLTATYMEVVVVEQFPPVFVPDDCRPGFPLGNAEKDNLVAQHVLVVKVRGLRNLSSLTRHHPIIYRQDIDSPENSIRIQTYFDLTLLWR